jgi:hypothetical protein
MDWMERKVGVDLTNEAVKNCTQYDPTAPLEQEYETILHDYYGWAKYWE